MNTICENIEYRGSSLYFAGQSVSELAARYGTPLYLMDEDRIRRNCRVYTAAFKKYFPEKSRPIYASKAASFKALYNIIAEEGLGCDLVSSGEIYTAAAAGFPCERAFFHSNNKTDEDIRFAIKNGVGHFVCDGLDELLAVEREAAASGKTVRALLRLTPGIDPHTYEAVSTGKVDSKFGTAIETGQASKLLSAALSLSSVKIDGFHCHIGSQVFDSDTFIRSSEIMLRFMSEARERFGYTAEILNLGGGYGVRYTNDDPEIDIERNIALVSDRVGSLCEQLNYPFPAVIIEPGRSIVADAGMTVYTVGSRKEIPGYKNYISVDGGMTDNPRFALYRSRYTVLPVENGDKSRDFCCSVVGRCCESGDIIQENVPMPNTVARGDLIAVCTTGAYNYSMASNYNRIPRPPVVLLSGGKSRVAVRRESFEDIVRNDL